MERLELRGKCLCGEIEFTALEKSGLVFNCHCSMCRRSHGSDYATQAFALRDSLKFIKGEEHLKEYQSTVGVRAFCSHCGSRLMNYGKDGGDYLSIAIACLDDSFAGKAVAHCFTTSKAKWHDPCQKLLSFPEFPEDI